MIPFFGYNCRSRRTLSGEGLISCALVGVVVTHSGRGRDFPTFSDLLSCPTNPTSCSIAREPCTWCALNVDTDALALYSHLSQDMTATPLLSHFRPHFPAFPQFPRRFSLWQHVRATTIKPRMSTGAKGWGKSSCGAEKTWEISFNIQRWPLIAAPTNWGIRWIWVGLTAKFPLIYMRISLPIWRMCT